MGGRSPIREMRSTTGCDRLGPLVDREFAQEVEPIGCLQPLRRLNLVPQATNRPVLLVDTVHVVCCYSLAQDCQESISAPLTK
jgi:hypothetical protein